MLPVVVGQAVTRVLADALKGGLLVGTVTGVLYGWGRLGYYAGYLTTYHLPKFAATPAFADALVAPSNTIVAAVMLVAGVLFVLGLLAWYSGLPLLPGVSAHLLRARRARRRRRTERHSNANDGDASDGAPAQEETRGVEVGDEVQRALRVAEAERRILGGGTAMLAGALLVLGVVGVVWGGLKATREGEDVALRDFDACRKGSAGVVVDEAGRTVGNFCTRIGDDLITYSPDRGAAQVQKYDKQHILAAPAAPSESPNPPSP